MSLFDLLQDVRYAVRGLIRHKTYAAASIATLSLGIGASTAIFSIVNGVILRPLPFADPDSLVQMYGTPAIRGEAVDNLPDYRSQSESFDALVGYGVSARYLRGPGGAERVMTVDAERGLFSLLGVQPLMGRTFQPGDSGVAVIAEGFWRDRLGGDPAVLGRSVSLDDAPFTIVGVMPARFQFPYRAASLLAGPASQARTDVWLPLEAPSEPAARARYRFSSVTGRLRAGVSIDAADKELSVIAARINARMPDPYGARGVRLAPLSETVVSRSVRRPLLVLFAAVGLVLILACANVANLALAHAARRWADVSVRTALGASPRRLLRQFLTESLLLSLAGGIAGVALAWWLADAFIVLAGPYIPRAHEVHLDWRVFVFLFAACAVTGAAIGTAPAVIAGRVPPQAALQQAGSRSTPGTSPERLLHVLVVVEIAIAFALTVGATLAIRELVRLRITDTGMITRNVVTFHLGRRTISRGRERPYASDVARFYEIAERVSQLPGVRAAGFTQMLPLQNWGWTANSSDFRLRGGTTPIQSTPFQFELRYVTPGYFQALGIPLRRGRLFTVQDNRDAPGVILINEALARRAFPGVDPIGIETNRGTIVGIVGNVRQTNIERPAAPEVYYPIAQNWSQLAEVGTTLVVSTTGRPDSSVAAVRDVVREIDPEQAVFSIKTMDDVIADWLSSFTLFLWLMGAFAVVAIVLASTGAYAVIAYATASRTREFAIRAALGACNSDVVRLVLQRGVRLVASGLAVGLVGTLGATPVLQDLPVTVRPPDPMILVPVGVLLTMLALVACFVPARRAARVDPMSVLRSE